MALFTGKGDGGTTKAFDTEKGVRISKASLLPETLGTLDEVNAFVGFVRMRAGERAFIAEQLRSIQETLFIVQAQIAGADKQLREGQVAAVEQVINDIEQKIPRLKGFCLAGGSELSALLDVARTMARRAERRVTAVAEEGLRDVQPETKAYLNRLSSLLFALARLANHEAAVPEENPRY